jgi:transposase-like protein
VEEALNTLLEAEALIEMYLGGLSVRRVADITPGVTGARISASMIARFSKELRQDGREGVTDRWWATFHAFWTNCRIVAEASLRGEVKNVSVLVAIVVAQSHHLETRWTNFLHELT